MATIRLVRRAPLRRFETRRGRSTGVATCRPPAVRFTALQSIDMHAACSSIGFPTPVSFSPFPTESTVPDRLPSPDFLRNQVHPLVSFAPLCSPPSPCLPAAFRPQAPSMGLPSLIAASPTGVVTVSSHTHRLSVLGVSHALDGFVRRLALQVCFTPQPRPGFTLQGFIPRPQREHLVDAPCPLVGSRRITFASCPATPRSDAPPSGLCSASESGT